MRYLCDEYKLILITSTYFKGKIDIDFLMKFRSICIYVIQDDKFLKRLQGQLQGQEMVFYLDRFILVLPEEYEKKTSFWKDFYSYFGERYLQLIDLSHNIDCISGMLSYITENVNIVHSSVVLDYGCGCGLSSNVDFLGKIIGYDPVEVMRRQAQENGLFSLDIQGIKKLPSHYFDAVFASYVFHMAVDEDDIKQVIKKMKPESIWIANYYKKINIKYMNDIFKKNGFEGKIIQNFSKKFGLTYEYRRRIDVVRLE